MMTEPDERHKALRKWLARSVMETSPLRVALASVMLAESVSLALNVIKAYFLGIRYTRDLVVAGLADTLVISLVVGTALAYLFHLLQAAEREKRAVQARADAVITGLSEGVSIIGRDYRITFQNESHRRTVGDRLGLICYESIHGREEPCDPCPATVAFETGKSHRIENSVESENGTRHFGIAASPLKDEAGDVFAAIELVRDITEPKLAELALRESERRFQQIALNMDAALWMATPEDGGLIYASPRFDSIWGVGPEEFSRLRPFWLGGVHEGDKQRVMTKARSMPPESRYRLEYRIVRPDGTVRWVENSVFPIFGEDGSLSRQAGIAMDVTGRRSLEEQKADMMAMLRHDMKNPISVIAAVTETMRSDFEEGGVPDEGAGKLETIRKNALMLSRMLDDMALISRLESGAGTVNCTAVDVAELVMEVRVNTVDLARRKHQALEKDLPAFLPLVWADRMHVERSLGNLVLNAINYTPDGGHIGIYARVETREGKRYVVVSVADDGPGIPADEREKVFEKHYRVSATSEIPGSGLGLPMVKAAAEANGGFVELHSEPGKGSTFRLFLPAS